ncbi:Uncharacterized protein GBIM_12535, partial [Gryllus bimaculatus]
MSLKSLLQKFVAQKKDEFTPEEREEKESKMFLEFYKKRKSSFSEEKHKSYSAIPRFFYKLPKQDDILAQKLREEARAMFLQKRGRQLLNNNELKALWVLLENHHSPPLTEEDQFINYHDFLEVASQGGPKCQYGTGTLTRVFMERVFQECLTYDGEMDYKTYLDFVLAMENRQEPQSLQYLFRILDIHGKGFLDTFCLNYFFR